MKIYLGADHRGFELKQKVFAYLEKRGYEVEDCGAKSYDKGDDFPIYARAACLRLLGDQRDEDPRAILICGSGHGVAMAANRFGGIRAANVRERDETIVSRREDCINVLTMSADYLEREDERAASIIEAFLSTPFSDLEKYERRIKELDELGGV